MKNKDKIKVYERKRYAKKRGKQPEDIKRYHSLKNLMSEIKQMVDLRSSYLGICIQELGIEKKLDTVREELIKYREELIKYNELKEEEENLLSRKREARKISENIFEAIIHTTIKPSDIINSVHEEVNEIYRKEGMSRRLLKMK